MPNATPGARRRAEEVECELGEQRGEEDGPDRPGGSGSPASAMTRAPPTAFQELATTTSARSGCSCRFRYVAAFPSRRPMATQSGTIAGGRRKSIGTKTSCVGIAEPMPTSNSTLEATAYPAIRRARSATEGWRSPGKASWRAAHAARKASALALVTRESRRSSGAPARARRSSISASLSWPVSIDRGGCRQPGRLGAHPERYRRPRRSLDERGHDPSSEGWSAARIPPTVRPKAAKERIAA